jgi:hypothetical protein
MSNMTRKPVVRKNTQEKLLASGYSPTEHGVVSLLRSVIVDGKKSTLEAATLLGCTRSNVVYWMRKHGLTNPRGRGGANNPHGRRGKENAEAES